MNRIYSNWRYYRLGRGEYEICMSTSYRNNINALSWANIVFFVLAVIFSIFPIVTENNYIKSSFYLTSAVAAMLLFILASYQKKRLNNEKPINEKFIYALIFAYYINVMFFGMYLAVWAEPEKIAGSFIGILICVLFLFNISPVLYLYMTLSTIVFYVTCIINFKAPSVWNYDIQNAFFACSLSLIFGWQIIMSRMTMMSSAKKLKDENTIDSLTKLKNRRDFMNTFQRFLTCHRQSDKFLCVAILDIDCFKNYNDHYGHPKGDECLCAIGDALNSLQKNKGIYAARIGGEEFALLWHTEDSQEAEKTGLYVNLLIQNLNIPHEKSIVNPYITVSVGIHVAKCGSSHDIKDLYNLADKALYSAKSGGRNRTVVSF